jgi:hypothetical protein
MPGGGRLQIGLHRNAGDLVLSVRDEGRGLPRDEQRRLFEPLAASGRAGSGLGLAIVFQIVRQHGGDITVLSAAGQGHAVRRAPAAGVGARAGMSRPRAGRRRDPHGAALALLVLATFAERFGRRACSSSATSTPTSYPQRSALRRSVPGRAAALEPVGRVRGAVPGGRERGARVSLTWLLLPLPVPLQFEIFASRHCLLAALGAAALARRLLGSELGACLAGAAYALAGPTAVGASALYHHFAGAALMPWVLWALRGRAARTDRRQALVLGALAACRSWRDRETSC